MEIDNPETEFALVRQGYCQENSILKLNQHNVIGRGFETSLTLISLYISRIHCEMHYGDDGNWYIRDCGTLNGTYINDLRIEPNIDYCLKIGDKIGFGIGISSLCASEDVNPDYYVYKLIYSTAYQGNIYGYDVSNLCWDLSKM